MFDSKTMKVHLGLHLMEQKTKFKRGQITAVFEKLHDWPNPWKSKPRTLA